MKFEIQIITCNDVYGCVNSILELIKPELLDRDVVVKVFEDLHKFAGMLQLPKFVKSYMVSDKHRGRQRMFNWMCQSADADTDIIIHCQDDAFPSKGCMTNMFNAWEAFYGTNTAAIAFPVMHGDDLVKQKVLKCRSDLLMCLDKLDTLPRNPGWEDTGFAKVMHSVHGSGFGVRKSVFDKFGKVTEEHWAYDEDLSYQIYTKTEDVIIVIPGANLYHIGGLSGGAVPEGDRGGDRIGWFVEYGKTHEECAMEMAQSRIRKGWV